MEKDERERRERRVGGTGRAEEEKRSSPDNLIISTPVDIGGLRCARDNAELTGSGISASGFQHPRHVGIYFPPYRLRIVTGDRREP